jgi:HSP20 family protein
MASDNWDVLVWRRAGNLRQQAERIQRNFLQMAVGAHYRMQQGSPYWEPPVNVIETEESLWVISALPGVTVEDVTVRIEGRDLIISGKRPVPSCCQDGELRLWEIPLGRFERRLTLVDGTHPLTVGKVALRDGLLNIELRKNA